MAHRMKLVTNGLLDTLYSQSVRARARCARRPSRLPVTPQSARYPWRGPMRSRALALQQFCEQRGLFPLALQCLAGLSALAFGLCFQLAQRSRVVTAHQRIGV